MIFKPDIRTIYGIEPIQSERMDRALALWKSLEVGNPPWTADGTTKTIKFSNTVARELARLITMSIDVKIDGQGADYLQDAIDNSFLTQSQDILERVIRTGGVMAKWNGESIDYLENGDFFPIETDSAGNIISVVFVSSYIKGKHYYTRMEWHRFEGKTYKISNTAFISDTEKDLGREIPLADTKWSDIQPETSMEGLEHPLFVYLKNPHSNTIDRHSPLGVSIFSECIEELRWLDIAMSTLGIETEDSKPVMFIDEASLMQARQAGIEIPRFVQGMGSGVSIESTIQQWQPGLQVASRKEGINFYLSLISYKCGFDPGYFEFNGQRIMATATQVEATERRTIGTVISYRNLLDRPATNGTGRVGFIHDLAYIIDAMGTATGKLNLSDYGRYEIYADFADLTSNEEENKAFDLQLAQAGYMSKWRFLVRHLGCTEEEARQMVQEAQQEAGEAVQALQGVQGFGGLFQGGTEE